MKLAYDYALEPPAWFEEAFARASGFGWVRSAMADCARAGEVSSDDLHLEVVRALWSLTGIHGHEIMSMMYTHTIGVYIDN